MIKKLMVLAVLSALSCASYAQSNVTFYGVVDAGLAYETGLAAGGGKPSLMSGMAQGSRFGLRGTEDLGNGLTALFRLEGGILVDTGASAQNGLLFGRAAFVGLQNNLGTVTLGRQYTPMDTYLSYIDPYENNSAGKAVNLFNRGYAVRMDNAVVYRSPRVAGFSTHLAYGFGEVAGDSSRLRGVGGSLYYDLGPFHIGLAQQNSNTLSAAALPVEGNAKNTVLGTMYNFGFARVTAAYGWSKTSVGANTSIDARNIELALQVPFGAHTFITSYVKRDDRLKANADAHQISLGYRYAMSKRTSLYATFAHITNKNGAVYAVNSTAEAGAGNLAYNVGIRHAF